MFYFIIIPHTNQLTRRTNQLVGLKLDCIVQIVQTFVFGADIFVCKVTRENQAAS